MTAWVREDFRRSPPPRSGASAGRKRWPARDFRVRGGSCAHGERRHCATSGRKWRGARGERYAPATFLSRRIARHRPIRARGGACSAARARLIVTMAHPRPRRSTRGDDLARSDVRGRARIEPEDSLRPPTRSRSAMTPRCRSPSSAPVGAGVRMGRRPCGSRPPRIAPQRLRPGSMARGRAPGRAGVVGALPGEPRSKGKSRSPRPPARGLGGGSPSCPRAAASGPPVRGRGRGPPGAGRVDGHRTSGARKGAWHGSGRGRARGGGYRCAGGGVGTSAAACPTLPPLWITLGTGGGQVGSGVWTTRTPLGILEGAS